MRKLLTTLSGELPSPNAEHGWTSKQTKTWHTRAGRH